MGGSLISYSTLSCVFLLSYLYICYGSVFRFRSFFIAKLFCCWLIDYLRF